MFENDEQFNDEISAYDEIGETFDVDDDPLEKFDEQFQGLDLDPLEIYKESKIEYQNVTRKVKVRRKGIIDRWSDHMENYDRAASCPNVYHVGTYIRKELSKDIGKRYMNAQLRILSNMFEYWEEHPKMPHGTGESSGYNPIESARKLKEDYIKRESKSNQKPQHRMAVDEIGRRVRQIKHILHRSVIATQFKYGSRGGQVSNLQIQDVKIDNPDLIELYPEMGSHPRISGFDDDVILFVHRNQRMGGKSKRPIVMPIDNELRGLLTTYLRQRPPVDLPWLFINFSTADQLNTDYITDKMWKPAFHPEYAETEIYDSVTSHYARHRFNTYWKGELDENIEYIKYMRGDKQNKVDDDDPGALDEYVHTYYENIRKPYLDKIYKFHI